jgi:hypothetical protein
MMELCSDGHLQVCFESRDCPVCEEQKKISDLEDKIYDLNETIEEMKKGE